MKGVSDITTTGNRAADSATFRFSKGNPGIACAYYEFNYDAPLTPESLEGRKPDKTGIVPQIQPSLRDRKTHFAMRFDGYIAVAKAGEYKFIMTADDNGRLYIDNKEVATKHKDGTIQLDAGMHALCVTYGQHAWAFGLKVEWEGPGLSRQEIPATVLFHGK